MSPRPGSAAYAGSSAVIFSALPNASATTCLIKGWPVIIYLQSCHLSPEQVLPLEVAMMNALSRPLRKIIALATVWLVYGVSSQAEFKIGQEW